MLPVVAFVSCALHVCFRDIASTKKKAAQEREGWKGKLKKLSESARGLRGRAGAKEHRHVRFADEMSDHTNPDSKDIESNEEAIATSMFRLAIACIHMQQ